MKMQKSISYSFENYLVETAENRVWRGDEMVPLTPKAYETLLVLLKNRGQTVAKEVLLNEVWADTFVEEATLVQNISTLRKALGDLSGGKQFIETVPRRGYRFVAPVREVIADEELIVVEHHVRTQITAESEQVIDENTPSTLPVEFKTVPRAKTISHRFKQHKFLLLTASLFACLLLAGAVVYFALQPASFAATKFRTIEALKLTENNNVSCVAVSPDGKYIALVEQSGANQALLLRQIDDSKTIEILPPQKQWFVGLTFAPDGKQIYYVAYQEQSAGGNLIGRLSRISLLGGTPQHVIDDVDSPITIAPDGKQFAFVRNYPDADESMILIANFDNSAPERKIATRRGNERFSREGLSWSPNGKEIFAAAYLIGQPSKQMIPLVFNANDGRQKSLSGEKWNWIGQPAWLSDGSGIVFPASSRLSFNQADDIWLISYPQGAARKITNGVNGAFGLSLTTDANFITAVKSDRLTNFWISSAENTKQTSQISQNLTEFNMAAPGISWTMDDQILYGATLNGNLDVWRMNANGGDKKQLTIDPGLDFAPVASSDGRFIIFISTRLGRQTLWRMNADGSDQQQLNDDEAASAPSITPDNKTVFYTVLNENAEPILRRLTLGDGGSGKSEQFLSSPVYFPKISPDGKMIACYLQKTSDDNKAKKTFTLTLLSSETARIIKQFGDSSQNNWSAIDWENDQTITYLTRENDVSRLWRQSISEDKPQLLIDSPAETIFRFAWSPKTGKLIYEKGIVIKDIILVESKNK